MQPSRRTGWVLWGAGLLALTGCAIFNWSLAHVTTPANTNAWFSSPELRAALDEATHSKDFPGHSVRLLDSGSKAFARRYQNLEDATFVLLKTYAFLNDEEGARMAQALVAVARRGVPVLLQYDRKGSAEGDVASYLFTAPTFRMADAEEETRVIKTLREGGVFVVGTNGLKKGLSLLNGMRTSDDTLSPPVFLDDIVGDAGPPLENPIFQTLRMARLRMNAQAEVFAGTLVSRENGLTVSPRVVLRRAGEALAVFNHSDHEKYFITGHPNGEVRLITGGTNIGGQYSLGGVAGRRDRVSGEMGWRDTDVEVAGPAAVAAAQDFLDDIQRHILARAPERLERAVQLELDAARSNVGPAHARFIANHPFHESTRNIEEAYRLLIEATPPGEPIFITTPYFAPNPRLTRAIQVHTEERHGTVTVLTNSEDGIDYGILADAARYSANVLLRSNGFRMFERAPDALHGEVIMHQKVASFGRSGPVVVGSFNLDALSLLHNTEDVVVVEDPVFRAQVDAMWNRDMMPPRTREVTLKTLDKQNILARMRAFLMTQVAWYWL